jgi:mono/diheme cytochrome c family protein
MRRVTRGALLSIALALAAPALAADDTGARLYFNHCAACHGDDGEGTGPVAASMRVTVPNLRTLAERNGGTFPTETVTAYVDGRDMLAPHGDRQMPIWGDVFRGAEQGTAQRTVRRRIAAVVEFISTLQYRQAPP